MNNKKGITLIEVMASGLIIAIVIASTLLMFVHTIDMSKRITYEHQAFNLAKSKIEDIRMMVATSGFDTCTAANYDESDAVIDSKGLQNASGDFRRSTTVNVSWGGNARLTEVEVEISYRYRGEWKTAAAIEVVTLIVDIT